MRGLFGNVNQDLYPDFGFYFYVLRFSVTSREIMVWVRTSIKSFLFWYCVVNIIFRVLVVVRQ